MTMNSIAMNLLLLVPFAALLSTVAHPRSAGSWPVAITGWFFFLLVAVPLGGFLAAGVAEAFGQHLVMAPISLVEQPGSVVKVILACGVVGVFFSLGVGRVVSMTFQVIHKHRRRLADLQTLLFDKCLRAIRCFNQRTL